MSNDDRSVGARSATSQQTRVLVVDDDRAVREGLCHALRLEGYEVAFAGDGEEALAAERTESIDAIVLDVKMPRLDGLETCRRLRAAGCSAPVLILTARTEVGDRIAGLDAGADDYLAKPFALDELLARLRALLRRSAVPPSERTVLRCADLSLDTETLEVTRGSRRLDLTRTELLLLQLFLRNAGLVLTRPVIYERVWGYDFGSESNSLDVYIGYLRRKMEAGGEKRLIATVRGFGYVLRE